MRYNINDDFPVREQKEEGLYLLVVPVRRITIPEKRRFGKYVIYPVGSLNFDSLTEGIYSDNLESNRRFFNSNALVVFEAKIPKGNANRIQDSEMFFSIAFQEVEKLLNLIKFFYCKYHLSKTLIGKAGQKKDGKNVVFVFSRLNVFFTGLVEGYFLNNHITIGYGLDITNFNPLDEVKIFEKPIGEVGNIIFHALELNAMALEANTNTQKFIMIMNLFEYLMNPYSYVPISKKKGLVLWSSANNNNDYELLLTRIYDLTGGNPGHRTKIIHEGKRLEDITKDKQELKYLFKELQGYIYNAICDMMLYSDKKWEDWDSFRIVERNKVIGNKTKLKEEAVYSDNLVIIDLDFLDRQIRKHIDSYRNLYPNKEFKNIYLEDILNRICSHSHIPFSNRIISVLLFFYKENEHIFSYKHVKYKEKDINTFSLFGYYNFAIFSIPIDKPIPKVENIKHFITTYSIEENGLNGTLNGMIDNFYLCADDDGYKDFVDELKLRKNFQLIKLNSGETKLEVETKWVNVGYVIADSLGLERMEW